MQEDAPTPWADFYYYYLLTAIGLSPGGSSPTLVQTKIKINKTKLEQQNNYKT
jgi:hypothetical protein